MASTKDLVYALLAIAIPIALYFYNKRPKPSFPVVNAYPNDYDNKKAYASYASNAKQLIANGLAEHQGPVTILAPGGPKVILPASLTEWAKANKDLDHQELVKDDFFSDYPGFEAQTAIHHPDRVVINVIKAKLSKNEASFPAINSNLSDALAHHWGDSESWHAIDWQQDTTCIISRAAAAVFVGPDLAKDPEWQQVTIKYVTDYFTAVTHLQYWPAIVRPIAHYFNPFSRACKQGIARTRELLKDEMTRRDAAKASGTSYSDTIEWTTAAAGDHKLDQAAVQLGLAVAALFTTSEALRQTILELCKNPETVSELREEIQQVISEHGWTMGALFKMKLLDSVLKESQRTLPPLGKSKSRTSRAVLTKKRIKLIHHPSRHRAQSPPRPHPPRRHPNPRRHPPRRRRLSHVEPRTSPLARNFRRAPLPRQRRVHSFEQRAQRLWHGKTHVSRTFLRRHGAQALPGAHAAGV